MKWFLHILFVLWISFSFGQQLNIHLDKEEVQIGEPFKITYSIISKAKLDSIVYSEHSDFFPAKNSENTEKERITKAYEIEISKGFTDTSYEENEEFIWKGSYELIAWDSAFVIIPPEIITLGDSVHFFPVRLIYVMSPNADPSKPIYDINESFTKLPKKNPYFQFIKENLWWITLVSALLTTLGIYLIRRSFKEPAPISLRQKTLTLIGELEKSKLYEDNLKEYYFELSVILRRFFAGHYQSKIMDKTTTEIEVVLAKNGLDKEMILLTRQLLMQSDMVKFAQSVPTLNEIQNITNDARRVVNEIIDLELKDGK